MRQERLQNSSSDTQTRMATPERVWVARLVTRI